MILSNLHSVLMFPQASLQVVEEHELLASVGPYKRDSVVNRIQHHHQSFMLVTDEVLIVVNQQTVEFISQVFTQQNFVCLGTGGLVIH